MKLTQYAIENRTTTLVLTVVVLFGGVRSYQGLSRLEDPAFTIKDAKVITPYPGASAEEVEEEVTDKLELAVQKLGQLDRVTSESMRGMSVLTPTIKDKYDKETLPQVWDELRRKVGDAQSDLPPGAGPSLVNDDFGDVFGVFLAITGEGYSFAEIKEHAKLLRRELLLVDDVAKIDFFGDQQEVIYVEFNRDRMSQLGIPPEAILNELTQRNLVADGGRVKVDTDFITVWPTGTFDSVEDIGSLLIRGTTSSQQIYLRDIAAVRRGYQDPPSILLRYDGKPAIGLGISTVAGGNVVTMGEAVQQRMDELLPQTPIGMEVGVISFQSDAVTAAIKGFIVSLLEAVSIVILVLLFFMGVRSGLLIGFVLMLTIAGTLIMMDLQGIALQRISLGALIIALGMLVDNAIVIVDGMLIRIQKGVDRVTAATEVVAQTAWPLLGATIIAVLAFAAIGTSQDSTGEYTRSLYQVILISLLFSWVTAVTVTPLLGVMFLKAGDADDQSDPYGSKFYQTYRKFLSGRLKQRWFTIGAVAVIFMIALWGFRFVPGGFFPSSTRPQFMVDYWLPQGTHIEETASDIAEIEEWLQQQEGITHVSSFVGGGALRFILTYVPETRNGAYAQLLVDVDDFKNIEALGERTQAYLEENYPHSVPNFFKFALGPGKPGKIRARISGPDPNVLRGLADQAMDVLRADGGAKAIRTDWRQRSKVLRPVLAEEQANVSGISRPAVAQVLQQGFQGMTVGVFRERDELLPIVARAPDEERTDIGTIQSLQIWSPGAQRFIPLRQVVSGTETVFEDEIVRRRNRKRTIEAIADPVAGEASLVFERIRPEVEAIELPTGYELEWGGEYEDSKKAQSGLAAMLPVFLLMMVLIVIGLFNSIRQTLVIWLTVPLALIGVTLGLVVTQKPFEFMAVLGFLSLIGMLIKNAIVLIDEINLQQGEGKLPFAAILDSGMSRLRPVAMAASTTALGMIPLLFDAFFVAMAVAIITGLMFATGLTMIVVPVLYAIFYKVREERPR
jgi:multidrug efflux pump subunit AcrB